MLIDTGLPEANPLIKENITKLGFKVSDIKYLLTTTYPEGQNRIIHSGDWFTLNLCAPPYNFPPPTRVLEDWVPPFDRRQLALWEIDSLRRPRSAAASHREPAAAAHAGA